jgi:hypothetical protein
MIVVSEALNVAILADVIAGAINTHLFTLSTAYIFDPLDVVPVMTEFVYGTVKVYVTGGVGLFILCDTFLLPVVQTILLALSTYDIIGEVNPSCI